MAPSCRALPVTMFTISVAARSMSSTIEFNAADQVVIGRVRGNRDRESRRGADQRLPDAFGEVADVRVQPGFLHPLESLHETQHRAQQAEQGCQLGNGCKQIELFPPGAAPRSSPPPPVPPARAPGHGPGQNGRFDEPRHRPGRRVANRKRFHDVSRFSTVRTPLRNSVELICARCGNRDSAR